MAGLDLRALLLAGADAERQDEEQADRPEQDIDGEDRGPAHQTRTISTLTTGFLPVHSVAQRRTARRTASRELVLVAGVLGGRVGGGVAGLAEEGVAILLDRNALEVDLDLALEPVVSSSATATAIRPDIAAGGARSSSRRRRGG